MSRKFTTIGIMGKPNNPAVAETAGVLYEFLLTKVMNVLVEESIADGMTPTPSLTVSRTQIASKSDLVIVVGGDGSMLNAGRLLANYEVPVLGINRGYLGFLTDISPQEMVQKVNDVIDGNYIEEKRFLLYATINRDTENSVESEALNDIVLYPGEISKMLDFEVYIDDQFAFSQRSDGIIVSTPTGSTAYALSGGGPIMNPALETIVLVPMNAHTLSSRPIVVDANSCVDILVAESNLYNPQISCDGQLTFPVESGDRISIRKKKRQLWLLHPADYDYYRVLRSKLGWGAKL